MYVYRLIFSVLKPCGLYITFYNRNYAKYYGRDIFQYSIIHTYIDTYYIQFAIVSLW